MVYTKKIIPLSVTQSGGYLPIFMVVVVNAKISEPLLVPAVTVLKLKRIFVFVPYRFHFKEGIGH